MAAQTRMTPDEKREALFAAWMSTEGKPFASPEVAQTYQRRVQRIKDILQRKKPDQVPSMLLIGAFMAEYAGISQADIMYDYVKGPEAVLKFHQDFQPEYQVVLTYPGRAYDRVGYTLYRWPGSAIPSQALPPHISFQMVEGEYMSANEYDALIADPDGFCLRVFIPRVCKALEGFQLLPTFYTVTEMPFLTFLLGVSGAPPVQQAFQAFLEAVQLTGECLAAYGRATDQLVTQYGIPSFFGGFTKAPFDFLGDTLRGTRGVMLDLHRWPTKVLAAVERLTPIAIQMGLQASALGQHPIVFIPLHKGADGFMSREQFLKFYWPTLKATILGLIEGGAVPFLFVEGSYDERLDLIAESGLPAGTTMWLFDRTDMQNVKKFFGSWACFGGNVPGALFYAGTPQEMEDYVRGLVETVGQDGGFFLAPGIVLDHARPENIHTFLRAARAYGKY